MQRAVALLVLAASCGRVSFESRAVIDSALPGEVPPGDGNLYEISGVLCCC